LKRLGAPIVMVCALMFAFAPIVDGVVCGLGAADFGQAAVAGPAEAGDPQPAKSPLDSDASCVHGHCHHGSISAPGDGSDAATVRLAASALTGQATSAGPSAFLSGIERPPRA
jgi:hypothetical protein